MGRPSTDLLLYGFLEFVLHDIKKNPWLLWDIYGDAANDPLTKVEYGDKEPRNAIDWFNNNKINVSLWGRRDKPNFPAITIQKVSSSEMIDRTTIGDEFETDDIDPSAANIKVYKVYQDFTPQAYNPATGVITFPEGMNTYRLAPYLHMVMESKSGKSFVVKKLISKNQFAIDPNSEIDLQNICIMPVTSAWKCHRKRTRFKESYDIGVHASSDPVESIWLQQFVEYCLLKYKTFFLNARNMQLSTFRTSTMARNNNYTVDNVYNHYFHLDFETEMDWIDTIAPPLAKTHAKIFIADAPKTPDDLWKEMTSKQDWAPEGDEGREE